MQDRKASSFRLESEGKSDFEVAQAMNTRGYRTAPPGNKPFTSHSIRGMMNNRFYIGELPDGKGGWLSGKHEPFIDQELWDRIQLARQRNRTSLTVVLLATSVLRLSRA